MSHRAVQDPETAGAGRAESGAQRIEQRHAEHEQQQHQNDRHDPVDRIQQKRGMPDLRHKLADRRARRFCFHQIHRRTARHRQHRKHEHQHAHAADPVGEAPPDQAGVRQRFDIRQNARSRRRKTRHRLKKRIRKGGDLAGQHEGKRPEQTHHDPAERHGHEAFLCVKGILFRLVQLPDQIPADHIGAAEEQIDQRDMIFAVDDPGDHRQQEEASCQQDDRPQNHDNDGEIHAPTFLR